jgi:hypothetical protein
MGRCSLGGVRLIGWAMAEALQTRRATATGTDVRPARVHCIWPEWLSCPLVMGLFAAVLESGGSDGHWADAFPSLSMRSSRSAAA